MGKEKAPAISGEEVAQSLQVSVLQDTIRSLEEAKLKLLLEVKELKDKLQQQKEDQADIYFYLNKKCDESFEIIASLEEQLSNEQSDREIAEKLYEARLDEARSQTATNEGKLQARIGELENKVEMANSFTTQKIEMETRIGELETQLDAEKLNLKTTVESLENRFLLEREKLRKSYELKYDQIRKELEGSLDGKLSKKTQKTQIMNVVMKKELDTQSRHADRLLEINQQIMDKDRKMKIDLDLANQMNDELTLKLNATERKMKGLQSEVDRAQDELQLVRAECDGKLKAKDADIDEMSKKLHRLHQHTQRSSDHLDDMWDFLSKHFQRLKLAHPEYQSNVDSHEDILRIMLKDLAIKYPNELSKFLDVGVGLEQKKLTSQVGIPSWDQARAAESRMKDVVHIAVQTEDSSFTFPETSLSWIQSSSMSMLDPHSKWNMSRSVAENESMSVGGIYSLPTVTHHHPFDSNDSIASNELDQPSIKSYSYAIPPKKMAASRNDFIAKSRVAASQQQHHQQQQYQNPHPPPPVYQQPQHQLSMYSEPSYETRTSSVDGNLLLPSRRVPKIKHSSYQPTLITQDDNSSIDEFSNIKIAGRKFIPPVTLPKIKTQH